MVVTAEDIRIELRRDEFTEDEKALIAKKIDEYTARARKINPTAPEDVRDEYVTAGVIQTLSEDYDNVKSFSDGRFGLTKTTITENAAVDRFRKALLKLQGIRIWKP